MAGRWLGGGCSLVRKVRATAAWERDMDGVVVNVGGTLKYGRHPQCSGLPISIPNNEPAPAPEAMLHRLKSCLSSAKSRNPMSPAH